MTIENPEAFVRGLWDWGILDGCFGATRIKPTDIDGFVERNGKFLVIETKAPGVEIPQGQMITFKRLIDTGLFSILIAWGETNKPQRLLLMTRKATKDYPDADVERFRKIVSAWYDYANTSATPVPKFE